MPNRLRRRRCLTPTYAFVALLSGSFALADEPPVRMPQRPIRCDVEFFDTGSAGFLTGLVRLAREKMVAQREFVQAADRLSLGSGERERHLRADLARVTPSETRTKDWTEELTRIDEANEHGKDPIRLRKRFNRVLGEICGSLIQTQDVPYYWQLRSTIDAVRAERQRMLSAAQRPLLAFPDEDLRITRIEAMAAQGAHAAAIAAAYQLVYDQHQFIRQELQLAAYIWPVSSGLPMTMRELPCVGATEEPIVRKPGVAALPPPDDFYPSASKRYLEEGRVVVRVRVNEEGCATHAMVIQGSGFPSLDEAGLRVAFAGTYRPNNVDGVPVPSEFVFAVKFQVKP